MKHSAARTALAASLTLAFAAAPPTLAQDAAAVDDAVATTPAALTDLLGPDGIEGVQHDFYLHMQMPGEGSGIMHWSTAIEGDNLTFTMRMMEVTGEVGMNSIESQVYTAEGEFVESYSLSNSSDYKSASTAVREGDKVRVTSSYSFDGEAGDNEEQVLDYAPLDDAVPTSWLPLAFAYHLREGNELFTIRMSDDVTGEMSYVQVFNVEDVGTEMVEVGDAEHEAHVLLITMESEMDGERFDGGVDDEQVMQMYVLADGSIVRMRMEADGESMTGEAITAEEAAELTESGGGEGAAEDGDGADPAGDDPFGASDEIEDAGEDIFDAAE